MLFYIGYNPEKNKGNALLWLTTKSFHGNIFSCLNRRRPILTFLQHAEQLVSELSKPRPNHRELKVLSEGLEASLDEMLKIAKKT